MVLIPCLIAFTLAAALGWCLSGQLRRFGFLDHPNARSSHQRSTPRGGGLAFIGATLLALALLPSDSPRTVVTLLWIPVPLALVGLVDDRIGLPARSRLLVQWLTGLALALLVGCPWPLAPLAAVFAAGVINAINFMDGLDGLVAGSMAVWLLFAAALLPLPPLLPMAASLAGFLLWNWSPARLFMGDVGSTYLGALMAGLLLLAPARLSWPGALGLVLLALPLLGDATSCLLRRALAGQPIGQAHRLHLYQRLQQAGWSHQQVAALYIGTTGALATLVWCAQVWPVLVALPLQGLSAAVVVAVGVVLDRRAAVPFKA